MSFPHYSTAESTPRSSAGCLSISGHQGIMSAPSAFMIILIRLRKPDSLTLAPTTHNNSKVWLQYLMTVCANFEDRVRRSIGRSIAVKNLLLTNAEIVSTIADVSARLVESL